MASFVIGIVAFAAIVTASSKLAPSQVLTTGYIERSLFSGPCATPFVEKKTTVLPLGACLEGIQGNRKITRSQLAVQKYKNSNVVDVLTQGYSDTKCKKKLGKPEVLVRITGDSKCSDHVQSMTSTVYSYRSQLPDLTAPGMVVTDFMSNNCGGILRVHPVGFNFYNSYQCTNSTISGSIFAQSMQIQVFSEFGYIYEYMEPDCKGAMQMINLNELTTRCLKYGPRSSTFSMNRMKYPTPAPVNVPYTVLDYNYLALGESAHHAIVQQLGATAVSYSLYTASGHCNLYVSTVAWPTTSSYAWASLRNTNPESVYAYDPCYEESCTQYVTVHASSMDEGSANVICQLQYSIQF